MAEAPRALFVHGNYLRPDIGIPAHGTLVYCPRTHAAFGHPPHPFRDFLAQGVRVALGTDGLASNPDQVFPVKLGDKTFNVSEKDIIELKNPSRRG